MSRSITKAWPGLVKILAGAGRAIPRALLILVLAAASLSALPGRAEPGGTDVPPVIFENATWTQAGSPYKINSSTTILPWATLTIEPGVEIESASPDQGYEFKVEGVLLALGAQGQEIRFKKPAAAGWAGIKIYSASWEQNTGSVLEWVIVDGGGYEGSGQSANLHVSNAEVTVRNSQFIHANGDGILVDYQDGPGVAHVFDSAFLNNRGYAMRFEYGGSNPTLRNLTAAGNGTDDPDAMPYGGDLVWINWGYLNGAHTWENMGLPYLVSATMVTKDGALTIEPGVEVLAEPEYPALNVAGRLAAEGTEQQPITFAAADPELGWSGMRIMGEEGQPAVAELDHVHMRSGGHDSLCNLHAKYASLTVNNSRFEHSDNAGLCLEQGTQGEISNSRFNHNKTYALAFYDANTEMVVSNLSAEGNGLDSIIVSAVFPITAARQWPRTGIDTFDIFGELQVTSTGSLEIEAGVTLRFNIAEGLTVNGVLTATGTAEAPVVFTARDETTRPWNGLTITGAPGQPARASLEYATLEYGGYGGHALLDILDGEVTLDHCTLRHASDRAIVVRRSGAEGAALSAPAVPLEMHWSRLYDINGVTLNNLTGIPIPATFNWWGGDRGPYSDENPDGWGGMILGPVIFSPYLPFEISIFNFLPLISTPGS